MSDLFEELKRRRVIRAVVAYAAAAFVVLQVADLTFDAFGLPEWAYRFTVVLCAVGLPVTAIAAWLFDLKNGEIQRTANAGDQPARRASPIVAVAVLGGTVALAGAVTLALGGDLPGPVEVDEQLIAVAPFRVASSDASLGYLREGTVDLLAAKLTGSPRVVDPRTLVSAWQNTAGTIDIDLPEDAVVQLAAELGAGRAVLGSIVGSPQALTITASVLAVPGGEVVAETTLEGPVDSLPALFDRLAVQLLGAQAGVSLESLTSTPEATRHHLEGLALYRQGAFDEAVEAHGRALDVDSTFAAAAYGQYVSAAMIFSQPNIDRSARLAWTYRDRLSDKERRILLGVLGPYYPDATPLAVQMEYLEELTRRFPDYQEVWYQYGDLMSHYGAQAGIPDNFARSIEALERSLEDDPDFFNGRLHLAWIYAWLGREQWREISPLTPESDPFDAADVGLAAVLPEDRQYWEVATASREELEQLSTIGLLGMALEAVSFVVSPERLGLTIEMAEVGQDIVAERRRDSAEDELYRYIRPAFLLNLDRWDEAVAWSEANDSGDGLEHARRVLEIEAIWEGEVPDGVATTSADLIRQWWRGRSTGALVPTATEVRRLCAAAVWQARIGTSELARELAAELRPEAGHEEVIRNEALSVAEVCARVVEVLVVDRSGDDASSQIAALQDFLSIGPPGTWARQLGGLTLARVHFEAGRYREAVQWAQYRDRGIDAMTFYRPMLEIEEVALRAQGLDISADAVARALRLGGTWPPPPIPDPPFGGR